VAIYRLLEKSTFGPDEISRMTMAYEEVLKYLGLVNRADPLTEIVASKIIEVANTGELDPAAMQQIVLKKLGVPPPR
jgi:hypothetical protein